MRTRIVLAAVWIALVGCKGKPQPQHRDAAPVVAPVAAREDPTVSLALTFVEHLARGRHDAAVAMIAEGGKVTAPMLAEFWTTQAAGGGGFTAAAGHVNPANPAIIHVATTLEHGLLMAKVSIAAGRVAGFSIKPLYQAPAYIDAATFDERPIAVGTGKTALVGVLSMPKAPGPVPVVLLVQGSGGSDLDAWGGRGNVMPFRDLAGGLASRGIAVLRVDKATFAEHAVARKLTNENVTAKEEYLDPVGDAIALLAHTPGVDRARIYVLGHSMGGWLLPWILRDHPEVRGGIIAAGNARNIGDLLVEQDQYLYKLQAPGITDAQLDELRVIDEAKVARIHDPNLADDTPPDQLPYGSSARSWKFVQTYDPAATVAALDRPILLLQGGRDYNVTMVDHEMWKQALAGKDVTARAYPDLNHAFVTGTGKATPAELEQGGHVAAPVIEDIATWVKAR